MNQALATRSSLEQQPPAATQPKKIVYFATGAPPEVAADLQRLTLRRDGARLRVVVPVAFTEPLRQLASLKPEEVLPYRPRSAALLWLRLVGFLGFSRGAEVICLSARQHFRFLKLLALTLRGRASFSAGDGASTVCSLATFVGSGLGQLLAGRGPIGVLGTAGPEQLAAILASVRHRYPGASVHAMLPTKPNPRVADLLDSYDLLEGPGWRSYLRLWRRCFGECRFQRLILPCTDERFLAWKWLTWFLPIWYLECANEHLDAFAGRNLRLLIRHGLWRRRRRWEQHLRTLPVGVIGSASGLYLEKIVAAARSSFPGVPVRGLLPPALVQPTEGLFDSIRVVKLGLLPALREAFRLARLRKSYQCWIVPCTDEPYYFLKCMAFLWPLCRRRIYNELADGFTVRDLQSFWRHFRWRLRDHLSYQILAGAVGNGMGKRFLHLSLYALRLLGAIPLLWFARLRSFYGQRLCQPAGVRRKSPSVDVILLDSEELEEDCAARYHWNGTVGSLRRLRIVPGDHPLRRVLAAIQTSQAEFVCVLDSRCEMSPPNWLEQLLDAFDETVAQVGPQIRSPNEMTFVRGALFGGRKQQDVQWSTDHATRWHSRPEWLEVDALPWVCVVFRRRALLEMGSRRNGSGRETEWVDVDFCRQLADRGWASLCNRNVTATHPMASVAEGALSRA